MLTQTCYEDQNDKMLVYSLISVMFCSVKRNIQSSHTWSQPANHLTKVGIITVDHNRTITNPSLRIVPVY